MYGGSENNDGEQKTTTARRGEKCLWKTPTGVVGSAPDEFDSRNLRYFLNFKPECTDVKDASWLSIFLFLFVSRINVLSFPPTVSVYVRYKRARPLVLPLSRCSRYSFNRIVSYAVDQKFVHTNFSRRKSLKRPSALPWVYRGIALSSKNTSLKTFPDLSDRKLSWGQLICNCV